MMWGKFLACLLMVLAVMPALADPQPVDWLILKAQAGLDESIGQHLIAMGWTAASPLAAFLDRSPPDRVAYCRQISPQFQVYNPHHTQQYDWQLEQALRAIVLQHADDRRRVLANQGPGWLFRAAVQTSPLDDAPLILAAWARQGNQVDPVVLSGPHLHRVESLPLLIEALRSGRPDLVEGAAQQLIALTGRDASAIVRQEMPEMNSRTHIHRLDPAYVADPQALAARWQEWWTSRRDSLHWDAVAPNPAGPCLSSGPDCQRGPGRFSQ